MDFIQIKNSLESIKTKIAVAAARKADLSKQLIENYGTDNPDELGKILESYRTQLFELREKSAGLQSSISEKLANLEKQVG